VASYRFCRTDDLPLLAQAYNACCRPHDPALPALTVDDLKRAAREIDLWASSCMVAQDGADPVGVLLAAKREEETLIWRVGVHPEQLRRGHAMHLVTSLGAKLAILGPPKLVAELPAEREDLRAFFEACGYEPEVEYSDFILRDPPAVSEASDLVIPITLDELIANEAFDAGPGFCWSRAPKTLINRKTSLGGYAVASAERIEAYLLHDGDEGSPERRLLALGCADPSRSEMWLGLLMRHYAGSDSRSVGFERVHPKEVPYDLLDRLGFESTGRVTIRHSRRAGPA